MNDNNLTMELASILSDAASSTAQAKDFIVSQAPDVVQQTLVWYGIYNFFMLILGVMLSIAVTYIVIKFSGVGSKYEKDTPRGKKTRYTLTLTHDEDGELAATFLLTGFVAVVLYGISLFMMNLTWLQIWVAPKLFLIEKAADLVKG